MEKYVPKFKIKEDAEEDKTLEAVKALIDMKDISNEDEQGKFIELLKGIVFADNKHGDEFLKQINDFTSSLKIEDFKEGCKKSSKKKDIKEAVSGINNIKSAQEAIALGTQFINAKFLPTQPQFINLIGAALYRGLTAPYSDPEMEITDVAKGMKKTLVRIMKNVMDRV